MKRVTTGRCLIWEFEKNRRMIRRDICARYCNIGVRSVISRLCSSDCNSRVLNLFKVSKGGKIWYAFGESFLNCFKCHNLVY